MAVKWTGLSFRIMGALVIILLGLSGYVSCDTFIDGIVHIRCGLLEDNYATLTYFGDSHKVSAYMKDGRSCPFKQDVATATWSLRVAFTGWEKTLCVMTQLPNRNIFSIQVISRRGSSGLESEDDESYLLECNYEPYREEEDQRISLMDRLDPPKVVDVKAGRESNSIFVLQLVSMEGQILTSVTVGRVVRLKVTQLASKEDEGQGFEPVMCDVTTPEEDQVTSVLIDGCGTGYPFSKDRGFRMDAIIGISPPFRMFRLQPFKDVHFRCTFVTCHADCIGSSCAAENITDTRPRRDTPLKHYATVRARTETQQALGTHEGAQKYHTDASFISSDHEDNRGSEQLQSNLQSGHILSISDQTSTYDKWRQMFEDWQSRNRRVVPGRLESSLVLQNVNMVLLAMSIVLLSIFIAATVYLVRQFR